MKQINLLPYSLQQRSIQRRLLGVGVVAAVCAVATSGVLYMSVRIINDSFKTTTVTDVQPVTSATPQADADIKNKIAGVNILTSKEVDWQKAFTLVHGLAATHLSISAFTVTADTAGTSIKTVGVAPSNLAFATYLQTLEQDKRVSAVAVDTYTFQPDKGTVNFALTVTVDPALVRYANK